MDRARLALMPLCVSAVVVAACQEDLQSPPSRPEPPHFEGTPEGSALEPLDIIYVCGNKFLVTNATQTVVHVTYRVAGTEEDGSLTLREGSADDEGHSETELTTTERGTVDLYLDDHRVAHRRNGRLPCGISPMRSVLAGSAAGESGSWSAPFPWPVVALHLSLLPTGKAFSWGHGGEPHLWNPVTGDFVEAAASSELFCSGHSFLADGRLLVSGGHITNNHGLPENNIFDPRTESWSSSAPMRRGRWYPSNTTMGNGDVVIMAGRDEAGIVVAEPEVWSSGSVRMLSTAPMVLPYYPRAFLAPNGQLFYAGSQQTTRYLDPAGTGRWTTVGERLYGIRDYGAAVMYEPGKILYVGGGRTTNTAEIIDLESAAPSWQWTGSMMYPRRHLNATMLPTGEVLVTGGTSGTGFNDVNLAVHAAELWNPSNGTWTTLASNVVNRGYHATSLLLPDGRVLHTGSGDGAGAPSEHNAELFSPPYLSQGPRPTITAAPALVAYGTSFRVPTPDAADIDRVSLIRLGSVTHASDMNQRFQWLSFQRDGGELVISAPSSRNRTPPGHYLLFLLNTAGVPSVGEIVNVGSQAEPPPPPTNTPPVASFTTSCSALSCTFTDASTDVDGGVTLWAWSFGDGGTSGEASPGHTYATPGSYEVTLTATDNDQATGTVTQTVTVTGAPPPNTAPAAAFTESCDGFTCFFTDGSTDADGTVQGWSWDFGDGATGTGANPSHTYGSEGDYEVTLTATDDDGAAGVVTTSVTVTPPPPNTAPTSGFTHSCTRLDCKFSDGSADEDGRVSGWAWDFGDGGTATVASPSHRYAAEGTYQVTLTVTDDDGATGTITQEAIATPPPPNTAPSAAFSERCDGLTCVFTDASTDEDGRVAGWSWGFGDGESAATQNPSHTYPAEGSYQVTLVAADDNDAVATVSKSVTVIAPPPNSPPTAAFAPNCSGLSCSFDDRSTDTDGTVMSWSWDFGDGASETTRNPSHSYAAGGSYGITLKVTDDDGAVSEQSETVTITAPPVPNAPPAAAFTPSCTGLDCTFTDASTDGDGTLAGWSWGFGDAGSASTANPNHSYSAGGTYPVTLRVTDDDGASSDASASVTVAAAPPPANAPPTGGFTHSCANLTCTFTDASSDADGSVTGWSWNFGDGSGATAANPAHTFGAAGTYAVTLRVTDDVGAGNDASASVTVTAPPPPPNGAPAAAFSYSCTGLSCRFTDRSTDADGSVTAWRWTFGNGMIGSVPSPMRTYAAAGTYTVTLRATDDDGAMNSVSVPITVTASAANQAPAAAFSQSCTGLTCRFTDRSTDADGTIAAWKWTFGDGATSTARNPTRTYGAAGSYTVTLRTTDNRGGSSQVSAVVTARSAGIALKVTGRVDATRQYMTLAWSGARGTAVDIYRFGSFYKSEPNDGAWTNTRALPGLKQYTYKVCETGTTVCSSTVTVVF